MLKFHKLRLERNKRISEVLEKYSDNEEMQGYIEYGIQLKYLDKQFESAKNQVRIEKCMLTNGMLYGQERKIVKYNIQQIADEIIPWEDIYKDYNIGELLEKI